MNENIEKAMEYIKKAKEHLAGYMYETTTDKTTATRCRTAIDKLTAAEDVLV